MANPNFNAEIAHHLEEIAWLREEQGANVYRIQAYRRAAETLRRLFQRWVPSLVPPPP
jgi:DNA polymerase/3'-5' exonuclease PolX